MTDRSHPQNPLDGEQPENSAGAPSADNQSTGDNQAGYPSADSYNQRPGGPGAADSFGGDNAFGKAADATYGATGYQTGGTQPVGAGSYDATGGYPNAAYPGEYQEKNNMALWAMILGIIAFVLTVTIIGAMFGLGIILGIIAVVLGILGVRRAGKISGPHRRKGMAIAGIVLGALAIIASIAVFLGLAGFLSWFANSDIMEACQPYLDANDQTGYEACIEEETAKFFGNNG